MNILVIGNSHTGTFRSGWYLLRDTIPDKIQFKISGVGNPLLDKWRLVDSYIYPYKDARTRDDSPYYIGDFDLIIVCAGYSVSDPRLLYNKNIQCFSNNILTEVVKSCEDPRFQHSKHSPIIKSLLNDAECSNNILLVGSPYPCSSLYDKLLAKFSSFEIPEPLRGFYLGLDSNAIENCAQVHKTNCSSLEAICNSMMLKKSRIKYYNPPLCARHKSTLFTNKHLMRADGLHGNPDYGKLLFSDILSKILDCYLP